MQNKTLRLLAVLVALFLVVWGSITLATSIFGIVGYMVCIVLWILAIPSISKEWAKFVKKGDQ